MLDWRCFLDNLHGLSRVLCESTLHGQKVGESTFWIVVCDAVLFSLLLLQQFYRVLGRHAQLVAHAWPLGELVQPLLFVGLGLVPSAQCVVEAQLGRALG